MAAERLKRIFWKIVTRSCFSLQGHNLSKLINWSWTKLVTAGGARQPALSGVHGAEWHSITPKNVRNRINGDTSQIAMQRRSRRNVPAAVLNKKEWWSVVTVWKSLTVAQNVRETNGNSTNYYAKNLLKTRLNWLKKWRTFSSLKREIWASWKPITGVMYQLWTYSTCRWMKERRILTRWLCCCVELVIQGMFYSQLLLYLMFINRR